MTAAQSAHMLFDIVSVQSWTRRRFSVCAWHCAAGETVSRGETASRSSLKFSRMNFAGADRAGDDLEKNPNLAVQWMNFGMRRRCSQGKSVRGIVWPPPSLA